MYINTFKYTSADVDYKLCTEVCQEIWLHRLRLPLDGRAHRAGVVGYAEVVRQMFPHDKRLMARLEPLIRDFPGMLWKDERHQQRMEAVKIHLGHSKRRDTPAFFAVMFLFTSDEEFTAAPETACADEAQSLTMQGSMRFRPMITPSISLRGASTPMRAA